MSTATDTHVLEQLESEVRRHWRCWPTVYDRASGSTREHAVREVCRR